MHLQDDPQPSPSHNNAARPSRMKMPTADPLSGWKRVLPNSTDACASEVCKERHEEKLTVKPIKETAPAIDGNGGGDAGTDSNNILDVKKPANFADALERARRRNAGTSTLNPIRSSSHSNSSTLPLIQADDKPAPGAFGRETARGREEMHMDALNRKRLERYDGGQRVRY